MQAVLGVLVRLPLPGQPAARTATRGSCGEEAAAIMSRRVTSLASNRFSS